MYPLSMIVLRSRFFKDLWQVGDALFVAVSMVFTLDAFPVSVEINSILALVLQVRQRNTEIIITRVVPGMEHALGAVICLMHIDVISLYDVT